MSFLESKYIEIILTNHAMYRIYERVGNANIIKMCLEGRPTVIYKLGADYEILTPYGRLIGVFENKSFIIKTFVYPWRNRKDYYSYGRKSQKSREYFCVKVKRSLKLSLHLLPDFDRNFGEFW
ncbi:MAG: hypothetical protein ACTSRG_23125 [Candidatus Helarchaeota archaeon]